MPSLLRLRALPWLALIEVARTTKSHLDHNLSDADRRRVRAIAARIKGDPRKLTDRERSDLKRIARDMNLGHLARDVLPAVGRAATGRRRRR
jgi:hypothetical protein